jgi:GNAT superfamily N-acetyltransferase
VGEDSIVFQLLDTDEAIARWLNAAEELIAGAFPRPAMETTAALLAWHLMGVQFGPIRPLAVVATLDHHLVGFAGATPRPLTCAGEYGVAHVVSFVSVAPSARGRGVAAQLYDRLLRALPGIGRVLTFAIDGSSGMTALERAYARNGFSGRSLGALPPYAVLRQRVGSGTAALIPADEPTIALADDTDLIRHLEADPRGSAAVGPGQARAIAAWRLTADQREPLLLLENLGAAIDSDQLRETVLGAFDAFPDHAGLLVAPNFPATASAAAQAVGLRRLAGPIYRAWVWSRDPTDRFLLAQSTSHAVL